MRRIYHSCFMPVFLILIGVGGFSMNACGETENTSNRMPMEPVTCQGMIMELQNQLHAAHMTNEALRDENSRLNSTIESLENTLRRIRNDLDRGEFHGGPVPQQLGK